MNDLANMRESFAVRRQKPLVQVVRDELERMILGGEVPAGMQLKESSLAAQMGVSRAPVREAARSLERDGLVTTIPNQGVFVRELTTADALEIYDLRAMIAGYLCERVAARADDEVCDDLRARVAQMEQAVASGDEASYFSQNLEFHDAIAQAAHAPRAAALYVGLGKQVRLLRLRVLTGKGSMQVSLKEHGDIVAAIARGDAATARILGQQHHENGKQRLQDTLRDEVR